jgi:hypothetical protein
MNSTIEAALNMRLNKGCSGERRRSGDQPEIDFSSVRIGAPALT